MPQLLPGTRKNVDLGYFSKSSTNKDTDNDIELCVAITVNPLTKYNCLHSGKYKLTIIVGAQNCKFSEQKIIITMYGKWTDEEERIKQVIKIERQGKTFHSA